jgi:hypothetical protein
MTRFTDGPLRVRRPFDVQLAGGTLRRVLVGVRPVMGGKSDSASRVEDHEKAAISTGHAEIKIVVTGGGGSMLAG